MGTGCGVRTPPRCAAERSGDGAEHSSCHTEAALRGILFGRWLGSERLKAATVLGYNASSMSRVRTLLKVSRLPELITVWSNCLAGWWLGGAGRAANLPFLLSGITLLYAGAIFLDHAFSLELGRQPASEERSAAVVEISLKALWRRGFLCLVAGALCLFSLGITTGALGLTVLVCLLVCAVSHRPATTVPLFMGLCRFFIYVIAASTGAGGVTGWAIWSGLALAVYLLGVSLFAGSKEAHESIRYWALVLLGAPVLLAMLLNADGFRGPALILCALLGVWVLRSLRPGLWSPEHNIPLSAKKLVVGIVLVDLLAVASAPHRFCLVFLLLFGAAWSLQRLTLAE